MSEFGRDSARRSPRGPLVAVFVLLGGMAWAQGSLPRIVLIDPEVRYQTFVGWEATASLGDPRDPAYEAVRDQLVDRVVREVGISRLRIEVRSGAESRSDHWASWRRGEIDDATWQRLRFATVNDDDDPRNLDAGGFHFAELDETLREVALPIARRLEESGERLHLNLCYVVREGAAGRGYVHADPDEYAEFVLATFAHVQRRFDLVPDAWEVIHEPDRTRLWDGAAIGRALVATAARLAEAGFRPRFVAPSASGMTRAASLFDELAAVPGALDVLSEFSYHRYGRSAGSQLADLVLRAQTHGLDLAMLEHTGSPFASLHQDLSAGHNVSWSGAHVLVAAGAGGGLYTVDRSDPEWPRLTLHPNTRYYQQAMRYIRPGMTRIRAISRSSTLEPVAFVGEDGRLAVVVRGHTQGPIAIEGLPTGTYGTTWTTDERADVPGFDVDVRAGARLNTALPGPGVLSVFSR